MNDLQIFSNPEFGQVRTVEIDGQPWLVGKDVAVALGYKNPRDAITRHVDTEDKDVVKHDTPSGEQEMLIINESGLYSLILSSKMPKAKAFKHWVTGEVLPAIRKNGVYESVKARQHMRALWGTELVGIVRTSASGNIVQLFGRKVYVLGADNKKHIARIQGAAFEYAYGDEITTWDEGVFQMLKSRLSCPHSHFDGTCNPESPQHWFKKFLDSDADIYCQAYTIDDNPTLPPAFVASLKQEYAGTVYYNRFILGQWCAANGIIYQPFADSIVAGDGRFLWPAKQTCTPWRIHIGVDFGGNGSRHAFVATGILPLYAGVVGLASQRVDPRGQDADYLAAQLIAFCTAVFARYGEIHYIFCDSAEQTLINHIRARLRACPLFWLADRVNNSAKITIIDRIRLTSILMGGGRFWYMPEAVSLRDALAAALWSQKHPGTDERLDDGTTDIGTLDAFEYTIERDYKRFTSR